MKFNFTTLIFLVPIFFLSSCKKTPDPNGEVFQTGKSRTFSVESTPGFALTDKESGCVFRFPTGGSGDLVISPVTGGPELNEIQAERFMLKYEGTGTIDLLVPINGTYVQAFVYGPITGAAIKTNLGENSWGTMVEQDTIDGNLRYEILTGGLADPLKSGSTKYKAPPSQYFAVSRLAFDSDDYKKLQALYQTIRQVADLWLDALPETERLSYKKLMDKEMKYDVMTSSSNYYQHFNNWFVGKNAVFYLRPSSSLSSVAHETGHYLTHLLCGYTKYSEIYNAIPKSYWGLGGSIEHMIGINIPGRLYVLEEYSHFTEFLATGTVENYDLYNASDVNYFSQAIAADPTKVDYPSSEGFGTLFLASLMRTQGSIHSFDLTNKAKVSVPVINAPLGDIIGKILKKGPVNVNELYNYVGDYLEGKGEGELAKLPAILEPLGWSYYANGILVDEKGQPIAGAEVRSLVVADKEYPGPQGGASRSKGEFTVNRLPPGNSKIRIYSNFVNSLPKDSTDLDIYINPVLVTNEIVDLGTLVVEFKDKMETKTVTKIYVTRFYAPGTTRTGPTINSELDFSGQMTQSVKNKFYLSGSFLDNASISSLVTLQMDVYTDSPVTASFRLRWALGSYAWVWDFIDQTTRMSQSYQIESIPKITEEQYGEGGYAPEFTWSQDNSGIVEVTLTFDPKTFFPSSGMRRYRLNPDFQGTYTEKFKNSKPVTSATGFTPSSVSLLINKKY